HCILLGLSSKTRALWELSCLLEATRQSLACIRLGLRGQSCLHAPSTGCGPDVCIALCLLRRLAVPYLFRRLVGPYLLRRLAAPYLLRRLAAPYLLRRHYSLVISSGPKVAFVTPAIIVDCSNIEWFCLNIRKTKEHKNADNARVSYYSFYITSLDTVILVSTPKKTVTAYPDHIVGAKAKAATKRKALLSRNNLLVQLKSVD
ncbi:hypothetical protein Tco_1364727, partial [Tanacetum coccineum]